MNAIVSARLLGAIMVASLASAASGMDLVQQPAPGGDETPALRLPAFLDIARLPDLQDAWRLHAGAAQQVNATSTPAAAATPTPAEDEAAMQTARAALTRAEQVSREAAVVRERAEELSRRFGAEPAADAGSAPAAAEAAAPTETASIEPGAAPPEAPLPPPAHVLPPGDDPMARQAETSASEPGPSEPGQDEASQSQPVEVPAKKPAMKKKTAAVDGAPVIEEMATKPFKPAKPAKRGNDAAAAHEITQATNAKPSAPGLVVFEDSPTTPESDPSKMMPTELRSMGWNAQP